MQMGKRLTAMAVAIIASLIAYQPLFAAKSGKCGDNLNWAIDESGNLTITGSGDMWGYDVNGPWGSSVKSISMSNGVTGIGARAFAGCNNLTSVTISKSVKTIGFFAFRSCTALTDVTIGNSVTSIGSGSFENCNALKRLEIGGSVESIEARAFNGCKALMSIRIPNSVKSIGASAFYGCSDATDLTIGRSVKTIGNRAFCGCATLTSVTIPSSVEAIEEYAFWGCRALANLTIPNSVTTLASSAFGLTNLTDLRIDMTTIGSQFSRSNTLKRITIGNSVKEIGQTAFLYCNALTDVVIPNSVKSIGASAFRGCKALTDLTIGNSVETIGFQAFIECGNLKSIASLAPVPPTCDRNVFDSPTYQKCVLRVPRQSMELYKKTSPWSYFFSTVENDGVETVANDSVCVNVADGIIVVDGVKDDAEMEVYDVSGTAIYRGRVKAVAVPTAGVYIVRVVGTAEKVLVR